MRLLQNKQPGLSLIALITLSLVITTFLHEPIAQDLSYHQFKDTRGLAGIPNVFNVTSNLAFLFVGLLGLYKLLITKSLQINNDFKLAYLLLFASLGMVAFGSAYYHLSPANQTLAWDRLPMALVFMSFFSIIIYEYISPRYGKIILLPAILLGMASVIYWALTEERGAGDLRPYILIQFLPVVLTPVILLFFQPENSSAKGYWWLLLTYLLAKLFEHYDAQIMITTGIISGHSLKHLMAALGFYLLLKSYEKRQLISENA